MRFEYCLFKVLKVLKRTKDFKIEVCKSDLKNCQNLGINDCD